MEKTVFFGEPNHAGVREVIFKIDDQWHYARQHMGQPHEYLISVLKFVCGNSVDFHSLGKTLANFGVSLDLLYEKSPENTMDWLEQAAAAEAAIRSQFTKSPKIDESYSRFMKLRQDTIEKMMQTLTDSSPIEIREFLQSEHAKCVEVLPVPV